MKEERGSFSGGIGFVLAAAGSAVGLGNLWRFPYLAAQYGGGIFIFVYLILAVTFGFSLLTLEISMGRKAKSSALRAYPMFHKKFGFVGYLATLIPIIILPYYCVIGGWVTKYIMVYLMGESKLAADSGYFWEYAGQPKQPLVYFAIFLIATTVIVLCGVKKGVERVSKVLMPVLLMLTVGISIYVVTIPGAFEGMKYYLLPDFSKFSIKTVCAAMGQLFFSMSIAMGIMISYGSYVNDDVNLVKSVNHIEIFDTLVAFLSGLMIIPAVYVFGGEEELKASGVGLMFVTLPKVFAEMPFGNIIGSIFFVLVFLAALTSSISVLEAIVSNIIDRFQVSRTKAGIGIAIFSFFLGIPSALGFGVLGNITPLGMDFLSFFDYVSNSVLMPIVALCTCILFGWFVGTKPLEDEITKNGEGFSRKGIFQVMIRYVAPICLVVILAFYSLAQFGFISV
ncbi:MAG: sodium-dependent transporter [Lachnospiraceae bacterium]|nr:sodium-dependent transporter [Lachnospiraceae bacterium]